MHAYLVTGPSFEHRQEALIKLIEKYKIAPINLMKFTPAPTHGIDTIREITRSLSIQITKRGEKRGILLEDAHLMTPEAQNAFLKTLEEPPGETIIILTAPREDLLFPTIVSRCVTINTQLEPHDSAYEEQEQLFKKLTSAGVGEKILFVEEIGKDRNKAIAFTEGQIAFLHHQLHAPTPGVPARCVDIIKVLLSAQIDLANNVNPKMVLFELLKNYR